MRSSLVSNLIAKAEPLRKGDKTTSRINKKVGGSVENATVEEDPGYTPHLTTSFAAST